jgi:integrase
MPESAELDGVTLVQAQLHEAYTAAIGPEDSALVKSVVVRLALYRSASVKSAPRRSVAVRLACPEREVHNDIDDGGTQSRIGSSSKTRSTWRAVAMPHGWATLALEKGIHPKVVQERLGHANISITLDMYSHVVAGSHEDAAEQVAALFRAGSNPIAEGQ